MKINVEAVQGKISEAQDFVELERIARVTEVAAEIALQESEELLAETQKLLADCALQSCQGAALAKRR